LLLLFCISTAANAKEQVTKLYIDTPNSLLRIGVTPMYITKDEEKVAAKFYKGLKERNLALVREAEKEYDALIKKENVIAVDYWGMRWLANKILNPNSVNELAKHEKDYFDYFTKNDNAFLKEYLKRQYGLDGFRPEDEEKHHNRKMLLQDYMIFNDPDRKIWDKTEDIIKYLDIKPGDKIADIGSGLGYFTDRFSEKVGSRGAVYSFDTNADYIAIQQEKKKNEQIINIYPVKSKSNQVEISEKVDKVFMSSLYHIIYGWSQEIDRKTFIQSIKNGMKENGELYIADNAFSNGKELNNCYVYKELIISQLNRYGFKFKKYVQITPQRYLLVFGLGEQHYDKFNIGKEQAENHLLEIKDGNSVIHIGSLDSYDITEKGIAAGKLFVKAIEGKDLKTAKDVVRMYDELIPHENFGGEYSALQWFCELMLVDQNKREEMLRDEMVRAYYDYLSASNYERLLDYVKTKYKLQKKKINYKSKDDLEIGHTQRAFLEDFILFNNPKREIWEKTSTIIEKLPLAAGDKIADLGSGPGYYTYKFSRIAGDNGFVYAIDIKQGHLDFIDKFLKKNKITNVKTIKSGTDNKYKLPEKVDYVFSCSLYHVVYGVFSEKERNDFISCIKESLKDNGKLILIDNSPVINKDLPYHGPYISKELIISQLEKYGFKFTGYDQITPQRYMIVFQKVN